METKRPPDFRRLQALVEEPHETLDVELKPWLELDNGEHRADAAQALLALANHGGGFLIFGFQEDGSGWSEASGRPATLDSYSQDEIAGIVSKFADPSFQCIVQHVAHPTTGRAFPVVVVPGDHVVPIRAKRSGPLEKHVRSNCYYIRRPGPASETPQTAQEWDALIRRCVLSGREQLLESLRSIITGVATEPVESAQEKLTAWRQAGDARLRTLCEEHIPPPLGTPYANGAWTFTYLLDGISERPSLGDLRDLLAGIPGWTGWRPWWVPTKHEIKPYPFEGVLECWHKDHAIAEPSLADFWRAAPDGRLYLLRGHGDDDSSLKWSPGSRFEVTLPIWRVGECLFHAQQLARLLGCSDSSGLHVQTEWTGLSGRTLHSLKDPFVVEGVRRSHQDRITTSASFTVRQAEDNLPEIVRTLVRPLLEAFDLFEVTPRFVEQELQRARSARA